MPATRHDLSRPLQTNTALSLPIVCVLRFCPVITTSLGRLVMKGNGIDIPHLVDRMVTDGRMDEPERHDIVVADLHILSHPYDLIYSSFFLPFSDAVATAGYDDDQQTDPSEYSTDNDADIDARGFSAETGHFHQYSIGVLIFYVDDLISAVGK